jgi:hypothetical protein
MVGRGADKMKKRICVDGQAGRAEGDGKDC